MKTERHFGRGVVAALITGALGFGSVPTWASAQEDADDVRDKPLDKVERKLSGRGYERVGSGSHGDQQLWWNRDNDRCLRLSLHGQRVSHAEVQDERSCRDTGKHGGSHQNDGHSSHSQLRGTSSLIGMRASYLDDEMAQRGFRNVDGYKTGGTSYTIWWNKSMRECLSVGTKDGNVDTVRSVGENDCQ